jgi:uncharacterized Zn-finger protein
VNLPNNSLNNPLETFFVTTKKVSCDGSRSMKLPSEGHPLVYLEMGKKNSVTCPYCGKFFTIKNKK